MVVHYLGATIRQGHGVGTLNNPSRILSLCFSKLSSRVLVSYSILILIGTSRFFICRGMVYWGRNIRCWGFGDRRGMEQGRGGAERGELEHDVLGHDVAVVYDEQVDHDVGEHHLHQHQGFSHLLFTFLLVVARLQHPHLHQGHLGVQKESEQELPWSVLPMIVHCSDGVGRSGTYVLI